MRWIRLASSPERMEEIRRQISWATAYGLPLHEISPAEALELFPLLDIDGVVGGAYLASDGYLDPSQLCNALANRPSGNGLRVHPHTRVTGIDAERGGSRVHTDRGTIACETVVNCGGMFAAEIGRLDVRLPLVPMSHQYVVTEALPEWPGRSERPLADAARPGPARLLPAGGGRAGDGRLRAQRGAVDRRRAVVRRDPGRLQRLAARRSGTGSRRSPPTRRCGVPAMADAGLRKIINGPEAFTPDNEFCLARPTSTASSSPLDSARTASRARAASAR